MRVCIVYDCLYPWTVGGAERWYRALAERLVAEGHEVTYVTRRQWPTDDRPALEGIEVVAVSPGGPLYGESGNRRIAPPLRFGLGVLGHLIRRRHRYDAVHLCAFPYFSLLAARAALAGSGTAIGVDWFEVWTAAYWRSYLGALGGRVGALVQRLCVRMTPRAFVFSELHGRRLVQLGLRGNPTRLAGLYAGPPSGPDEPVLEDPGPPPTAPAPNVLFAGRLIAEKRATAVPGAIAAARRSLPELRGVILGDGPQRDAVAMEIERHGVGSVVRAPGFVPAEEVAVAMAGASCLVLPSTREGYGLVVIEAARAGTPSIVVAAEDNAAVELIEHGVNGVVAGADDPETLGAAIVEVVRAGAPLRASTRAWFERQADALSAAASAAAVIDAYAANARS